MKEMFFTVAVCFSTMTFAGEPTPAPAPADTTKSVLVDSQCDEVCSDCRIRRRGLIFRRGYVVVKHTVSSNSSSTTREVIDNCCNLVRSKTVTRSNCSCNCSCNCCK